MSTPRVTAGMVHHVGEAGSIGVPAWELHAIWSVEEADAMLAAGLAREGACRRVVLTAKGWERRRELMERAVRAGERA